MPVETGDGFEVDPAAIARAITPRTKAIILNSPNNPTGAVYSAAALGELNAVIREPVLAISDEPYRPLIYDGLKAPETLALLDRVVVAWSWSKAMAIAGERIGYLAISPRLAEAAALRDACIFANRVLGYVNAPALWQRVVAEAPEPPWMWATTRPSATCCAARSRPWVTMRPAREARFTFFPRPPWRTTSLSSACCKTKGYWRCRDRASAAAAICGFR